MVARTAYVPTAGTAIVAANHIKFPGGWIGYVEVTADQTGISALTDLTGLAVVVTVGTSRRLHIQGLGIVFLNTTTGHVSMKIRDGTSTELGAWTHTTAANAFTTCAPASVETPSSGSNTYKLSLFTSGGTVDLKATATNPAFLIVSDVGPSA